MNKNNKIQSLDLLRLQKTVSVPDATSFINEALDAVNDMYQPRYQEQTQLIEKLEKQLDLAHSSMWKKIRTDFEKGIPVSQIISGFGNNALGIDEPTILKKSLDEGWDTSHHQPGRKILRLPLADWDRAKTMYLKGDSPANIAVALSIPVGKIYNKAGREGWKSEREEIIDKARREIIKQIEQDVTRRIKSPSTDQLALGDPQQMKLAFPAPKSDYIQLKLFEIKANTKLQSNNQSGFRGVCKVKNGKYRAYLWVENLGIFPKGVKQKHLGLYDTPEQAAIAHDFAAFKLYNNTTLLNFPPYFEEGAI